MSEYVAHGGEHLKKYSSGQPSWINNQTVDNLFRRRYLAPSISDNMLTTSGISSLFLTSVASNNDLPLQYYNSPYTMTSSVFNQPSVHSNVYANPRVSYTAMRDPNETDETYNDSVFSRTFKGEPSVSVYKMAKDARLPYTLQSNDSNDTIYAVRTGSDTPKAKESDDYKINDSVRGRFIPAPAPANDNVNAY